MSDRIERAKAALDAGEPTCTTCGHKCSEHPYRHIFKPSHTTPLENLAPDLAHALIAVAAERDEALNQLDSALHSVDVLERRVAELEAELRRWKKAAEKGAIYTRKDLEDAVAAALEEAINRVNGCDRVSEVQPAIRALIAQYEGKTND